MSKRLPEAARNYSITELELCGLAINIANFAHLLKRVDFDAIVDHLALTHIIKSKAEPTTTRIKCLLELISSYSFNLYYMKGKDMILSDFLFRQKNNDSDPSEIIPISFNAYSILEENRKVNVHINFPCKDENKFLIQTCSTLRSTRRKEGAESKLEARNTACHAQKRYDRKLPIGQGRAGLRRKHVPDCINQPFDVTRRIPERSRTVTGITNNPQHTSTTHDRGINNDKSFSPDVLLHLPQQILTETTKYGKGYSKYDNSSSNLDIEENSPFQEGIISETIQRLDKTFFQKPKSLDDIIDMGNLIHKFLPKQMDIDKIL